MTAADPCDHRREQSWDWYWSFVLVVFLVGGLVLVLGWWLVVVVVVVVVVGLLLGFVLQCGLVLCSVCLVVSVWVFCLAEFVVCVVLI